MRFHGKDVPQQLAGQHVFRRARCDNFPRLQNEQPIAEHCRMVQIMQRNDAGDAKGRNEPQEANLVMNVEMVGRFVEDEFLR